MQRLVVVILACLSFACAAEDSALDDELGAVDGNTTDATGKADSPAITFTALIDPELVPPTAIAAHQVFTSQKMYAAYFGHNAPGVDFRRDWVVYYSAGSLPTGGTVAVDSITTSKSGLTLNVAVAVTPACGAAATAYALVRLHKQTGATRQHFVQDAVALVCPPAAITCDISTPCPGNSRCEARSWDGCTPNHPGCTGVCACEAPATACADGHFDSSVQICGCAPGLACGSNVCAVGEKCCASPTLEPTCSATCP